MNIQQSSNIKSLHIYQFYKFYVWRLTSNVL